ncbi:hypothetical protein LA345_36710 (plasmid) [Burkholderia vietnamiensis]|uniref:Uncharacterized protein n=1 Tax=Burkholderia vietnamiensis (strain G4 / LMG 22486) TaxID=269482 RepID=A4JVW3_BURVG|nr:hypothetical protein Bcep1808_7541 [Burkholderia vietnamiensis G4]MCB4349355.1 hypothetical protein [Burkholderia vietnamiensis]
MLRVVSGWLLSSASALFILYLVLHLLAVARLWSTRELPDQWPANLAIAVAIGAIGAAGLKYGISLTRKPVRIRTGQHQSR